MVDPGTRELRTKRLTLRRILPSDNEAVFEWMGDPEICKYERRQLLRITGDRS